MAEILFVSKVIFFHFWLRKHFVCQRKSDVDDFRIRNGFWEAEAGYNARCLFSYSWHRTPTIGFSPKVVVSRSYINMDCMSAFKRGSVNTASMPNYGIECGHMFGSRLSAPQRMLLDTDKLLNASPPNSPWYFLSEREFNHHCHSAFQCKCISMQWVLGQKALSQTASTVYSVWVLVP